MNVLIEPTENGYRATTESPWNEVADADTVEEALEQVRERVIARIKQGGSIHRVSLPNDEHPASAFIGIWKDNPLFEDWQKSVEEYRQEKDRELEEEENHPKLTFAGIFKDDPYFNDWQAAIAKNRKEADERPGPW
jgi:hypothetical protein